MMYKVSIVDSYTHLENLLVWMAYMYIFFGTHGKSEPFDSDERGKVTYVTE